jgi:hypothetical protein
MKLTEREQRLLPFLPTVAILLGYAWWFTIVQRPKVRTVQAEYRQAEAKQVRTSDLVVRQGEVKSLEKEVAVLEQKKVDLDRGVAQMTGTKPASLRHSNNRALSELLDRHHLRLVEESPVSKGGDARLPKSVKDVLGRLAESAQSRPGGKKATVAVQSPVVKSAQVRSIRFTGRFVDVLAAIQELSQNQDPPGIPIALSMAEANHTTEVRDWTLLVWM